MCFDNSGTASVCFDNSGTDSVCVLTIVIYSTYMVLVEHKRVDDMYEYHIINVVILGYKIELVTNSYTSYKKNNAYLRLQFNTLPSTGYSHNPYSDYTNHIIIRVVKLNPNRVFLLKLLTLFIVHLFILYLRTFLFNNDTIDPFT